MYDSFHLVYDKNKTNKKGNALHACMCEKIFGIFDNHVAKVSYDISKGMKRQW